MDKVKFHFDPRCAWSYQTSRWIRRLEELEVLQADWGMFSLEVVHLEEGKDAREVKAISGPALRTAIVIRDRDGSSAIGRFYGSLGKRLFEQAPPMEMTMAIRESLREATFDPDYLDRALDDPTTWDEVLKEHKELVDNTRSFGVPTIALEGGTAIFGPVISQLPTDDDAIELWRHVSWLARYENFSELKRDRTVVNDLPGFVWRNAQRESATRLA